MALGVWLHWIGIFSDALARLWQISLDRSMSKITMARSMSKTTMGRSMSETSRQPSPIPPFVCPSTWTARARLPASCRCHRSNMDPLVAAIFHNQHFSRLCRLSEELLLIIMQQLDPMSLQCLRRACRLFLRLYSSPEFSSSHSSMYKDEDERFNPWQQPRAECWPVEELPPLLARDTSRYCNDCRAARSHPGWQDRNDRLAIQHLHCSGCHIDHPMAMFSMDQRQESESLSRVCIAHEGFIRLCDHQVIKMDDVALIARSLSQLNTGESDLPGVVLCFPRCDNPSHLPKHHGIGDTHMDYIEEYPYATIQGNYQSDIDLVLRWVGHLYLPELDDKQRLSPELVHQKLEQDIRPGAAEHIAPELPPGRLPEMLCFDPNRCSCLSYPGNEQLGRGWSLMPIQNIKFPTCRTDATQKLGSGTHQAGLVTTGVTMNGSSWLMVRIRPCPISSQCLQVEYKRYITIVRHGHPPGYTNVGWCQALDPDSYNLTEDKEGFGVFWCRQKGCLNYYRYIRRPFARYYPKMHQECSTSCPAR